MHGSNASSSSAAPARAPANGPGDPPHWSAALAAVLSVTTVTAFMNVFVVTVGPALTAATGWPHWVIGYCYTTTTIGASGFLLAGAPLLRRAGPIRSLQIGLGCSGLALALLAATWLPTTVLASFLIGVGYGPTVPVSSEILQRVSPPRFRSTIFSAKQTGIPMGGVLAGLLLPGAIAVGGLRAAFVLAAVLLAGVAIGVDPMRGRLEGGSRGERLTARTIFSAANLLAPLKSVTRTPHALRLCIAGAFLGSGQGAWFGMLVTYLTVRAGLPLATAGALFALLQASAIAARLVVGWATDRFGSAMRVMRILAVTSALTTTALALSSAGAPIWQFGTLAVLGGVAVASWNGIFLAEIARMAPPGGVAELTSGAVVILFVGVSAGPSIVSTILAVTHRFDLGFGLIAAAAAIAFAVSCTIPTRR